MTDKVCYWDNDDATTLVHNKKAVEAAIFLMFITYTAVAIVAEIKREKEVCIILNK